MTHEPETPEEHAGHAAHEAREPEQHATHHVHGAAEGHDTRGGHAGHGGHGGHDGHVDIFRRLYWIMLVLAGPTVLTSPMFADLLGYQLPDLPGVTWVAPVLGTIMFACGGQPFLTGAVDEIRARQPAMMLLIGG